MPFAHSRITPRAGAHSPSEPRADVRKEATIISCGASLSHADGLGRAMRVRHSSFIECAIRFFQVKLVLRTAARTNFEDWLVINLGRRI